LNVDEKKNRVEPGWGAAPGQRGSNDTTSNLIAGQAPDGKRRPELGSVRVFVAPHVEPSGGEVVVMVMF
jgi:hypothetical protein